MKKTFTSTEKTVHMQVFLSLFFETLQNLRWLLTVTAKQTKSRPHKQNHSNINKDTARKTKPQQYNQSRGNINKVTTKQRILTAKR